MDTAHLQLVKEGPAAIAEWRARKGGASLDLSGADLSGFELAHADLQYARLLGARLVGANLCFAQLGEAQLTDAILHGAQLTVANLDATHLEGADLTEADLRWATLRHARAQGAKFIRADVKEAVFSRAQMEGADLSESICGRTDFGDIDLSQVKGLDSVQHLAPSSVGFDTILRSGGAIPTVFLRQCGIAQVIVDYLPTLVASVEPIQFYACFISFTEADDAFSQRLYTDLEATGVRCWRWKEDARWGRTMMKEVDEAIRLYDKLIVVLSKDSLQAEPVIREIERALQKEQREKCEVLFPVRLDDAVFDWDHELRADVTRKVIGDFHDWTDPGQYQGALDRLIRDLRAGDRR